MTKLEKAVEQTVKRYECFAVNKRPQKYCGFCDQFWESSKCITDEECSKCPIFQTERGYCDKTNSGRDEVKFAAMKNNIEACLAVMVYIWGFLYFGDKFIETKEK